MSTLNSLIQQVRLLKEGDDNPAVRKEAKALETLLHRVFKRPPDNRGEDWMESSMSWSLGSNRDAYFLVIVHNPDVNDAPYEVHTGVAMERPNKHYPKRASIAVLAKQALQRYGDPKKTNKEEITIDRDRMQMLGEVATSEGGDETSKEIAGTLRDRIRKLLREQD